MAMLKSGFIVNNYFKKDSPEFVNKIYPIHVLIYMTFKSPTTVFTKFRFRQKLAFNIVRLKFHGNENS